MVSKIRIAVALAVLAMLIDFLFYLYQPLGEDFYIIVNANAVFFGAMVWILGFYAFRYHDAKTLFGKALLLIAIAFVFNNLGDAAWAYQEVIEGVEVPTVSFADIFYLMIYPIFGIALLLMWKDAGAPLSQNRKFMGIFILKIIFLFAITSVYGFYPNYIDPELADVERWVLLSYIVFDFAVLAGMIMVAFAQLGKRVFKQWIVIMVAFAMITLADILYAQLAAAYSVENYLTMLWDFGYILAALGFYYTVYEAKKNPEPNKTAITAKTGA